MNVIHTYAKEYGWTRDYILKNVFIDEHILMSEIRKNEMNQAYLMQSYIQLVPQMDEEERKTFFNSFKEQKNEPIIKRNQKTDFDALKKAKQQVNQIDSDY